jgi:hypothetical protein
VEALTSALAADTLYLNPAGGSIGVGTNTPTALFDVAGFIRSTNTNSTPTSGKGVEIIYHTGADTGYVQAYDRSTSAYKPLIIDASTLSLNSTSAGRVGIGVFPSFPLHVKNTSSPQIVIDDNSGGTAELRQYNSGVITSTYFTNSSGSNLRSVTAIPLYLGTSNTTQMTISSTGLVSVGGTISDTVSKFEVIDSNNLGITINAPTPRYNMYESDAALNEKWWDQLAISGTLSFRAVNDTQSAASNWMVVDRSGSTVDSVTFPNGKIGIGTTPGYLLHVSGSQTNTVNIVFNSVTTAPGTNANMYGLIHYSNLNFVSGTTNFGTGQYLALTMNIPAATVVTDATSVVAVQPTNSGAGSVTRARTLQVAAPAVGTACNIATWTENISVGSGYFSNTPPTYGAIIQGNVGIGCTSFTVALQIATGGATDSGNYGNAIQTVRPTTGAVHLAMVRQGARVWGLGYVYNSNNFAIFNTPSTTDSSNTSPAFSIDTFNNAYFAGNVAVTGTTSSDGGYRVVPFACVAECYNSGSATQALVLAGAKLTIFDSTGISKNATPSSGSDNITITVAGTYQVTFRTGALFSVLSGGIGILSLVIQKNGSSVAASVQYVSHNDTNSTVMAVSQCLVDCAVNDILTIYGGSTPNQTVTFSNPYLSVTRVGSS